MNFHRAELMNQKLTIPSSAAAAMIALFVLTTGIAPGQELKKEQASASITLTSPAFQSGESIPFKYTCEGSNISPPLKWTGSPAGTKTFALICDDPDAPSGTWVHWVLFNVPASSSALSEKVEPAGNLRGGAKQGSNSFNKIGYGGPCPPPGKPHRYFFKLYALDTEIALKPGATKEELLRAMEKHVLAQGRLMGTCQRKK
jgi:hypothetical protein